VRLQPDELIVLDVEFASDRPEFAGTMTITWSLSAKADCTDVSVVAERVPAGISRADHELGMSSTLAKLAAFVE
jgi:Activator of Hsp90 ATPase homolog 1-like protein